MQELYSEIKHLIINTLNLDELSVDDIDTDAACSVTVRPWILLMRWSWGWR